MPPIEIIDLTLSPPERQQNITSNRTQPLSNGKRSRSSPAAPSSPEATNHKESKRRVKRKRKSTSKEPNTPRAETKAHDDELCFVDLTPNEHLTRQTALPAVNGQQEQLLLPQHVTVLAGTSVELEVQPVSDLEDDDFIKYVEYEDTKDVVRYFHKPSDETTSVVRIVCKNCGAEGLHKTSACRVQICLTCGARDEHSTRSCPISKICFSCGMKGHINANCTNRRTSRALLSEHECNRCSSSNHKTNECPTWWRLYEYFSKEDRDRILSMRQQKRDMKLGEGGEGYVAGDEWCYNCGTAGHWGDDCGTLNHASEFGHSAFSNANVMKGPFYDPNNNHQATATSRVRDWGRVDQLSVMADVGRKGRLKSKVALEKQAMETEYDNDDDWFANGRQRKRPPHQQTSSNRLSFVQHEDRYTPHRRSGQPSLLDRIQMHAPAREDSGPKRRSHPVYPREPRFDRTSLEERNRHTSDRRRDYGPRYKGGYAK